MAAQVLIALLAYIWKAQAQYTDCSGVFGGPGPLTDNLPPFPPCFGNIDREVNGPLINFLGPSNRPVGSLESGSIRPPCNPCGHLPIFPEATGRPVCDVSAIERCFGPGSSPNFPGPVDRPPYETTVIEGCLGPGSSPNFPGSIGRPPYGITPIGTCLGPESSPNCPGHVSRPPCETASVGACMGPGPSSNFPSRVNGPVCDITPIGYSGPGTSSNFPGPVVGPLFDIAPIGRCLDTVPSPNFPGPVGKITPIGPRSSPSFEGVISSSPCETRPGPSLNFPGPIGMSRCEGSSGPEPFLQEVVGSPLFKNKLKPSKPPCEIRSTGEYPLPGSSPNFLRPIDRPVCNTRSLAGSLGAGSLETLSKLPDFCDVNRPLGFPGLSSNLLRQELENALQNEPREPSRYASNQISITETVSQPPCLNNLPSSGTTTPQLRPITVINPAPVIVTTTVDSIANSLADTLQLLVVSKILESSFKSPKAMSDHIEPPCISAVADLPEVKFNTVENNLYGTTEVVTYSPQDLIGVNGEIQTVVNESFETNNFPYGTVMSELLGNARDQGPQNPFLNNPYGNLAIRPDQFNPNIYSDPNILSTIPNVYETSPNFKFSLNERIQGIPNICDVPEKVCLTFPLGRGSEQIYPFENFYSMQENSMISDFPNLYGTTEQIVPLNTNIDLNGYQRSFPIGSSLETGNSLQFGPAYGYPAGSSPLDYNSPSYLYDIKNPQYSDLLPTFSEVADISTSITNILGTTDTIPLYQPSNLPVIEELAFNINEQKEIPLIIQNPSPIPISYDVPSIILPQIPEPSLSLPPNHYECGIEIKIPKYEMLIPASIPAQLKCSLDNIPTSLRMTVEPLLL